MVNLATPAIQLKVDTAVFLINLQIQALVSRWVLVNISILGHLGLGCSVFSDDPVGQSKQGWSRDGQSLLFRNSNSVLNSAVSVLSGRDRNCN